MRLLLACTVAASIACSGCANLDRIAKTEQNIPITTYDGSKHVGQGGAVYLWPPYSSAAILDGKGNRCVLAASGAKTIDASAEATFKLGKLLDKLEGLDVSVKNKLTEAFTKLSAADSHAAFVDVALFHLCLFDQNGSFAEWKKNDEGKLIDHKFKANLVKEKERQWS